MAQLNYYMLTIPTRLLFYGPLARAARTAITRAVVRAVNRGLSVALLARP